MTVGEARQRLLATIPAVFRYNEVVLARLAAFEQAVRADEREALAAAQQEKP